MYQAQQMGGLGSSYLSQLISGKKMGDATARKIEVALGKARGWIDNPQWDRSGEPISNHEETAGYLRSQQLSWVPIKGIATVSSEGFWTSFAHTELKSFPFPTTDPEAYAVLIKGDGYYPTLKSGRGVIVEPGRPLKVGADVLVKLKAKTESDEPRYTIQELLSYDESEYRLQSVTGRDRLTISVEDVEHIHHILAVFTP